MRLFLNVMFVFSTLFFVGCGGESDTGGGNGAALFPTSNPLNTLPVSNISQEDTPIPDSSYDLKKVTIDDKERIVLRKEDAKFIPNDVKSAFATVSNWSKYEIEMIIADKKNESLPCILGGTIEIRILSTNNQVTFESKDCITEDSLMFNGKTTFVLDKTINDETYDYTIIKDFLVTWEGNSSLLNATIKTNKNSSNETLDEYTWDYYLILKNLQTNKIQESQLHIKEIDGISTNFSGIVINDNTYYTLSLEGDSYYLNWFGPQEYSLYDNFMSYQDALIFEGKDSNLTYIKEENDYIWMFQDLNATYYALNNEYLEWVEDLYSLYPNVYQPNIYVKVANKNLYYDKNNILFDQNITLLLSIYDNDNFGNYKKNFKLLTKPQNSNLSLDINQTSSNPIEDINISIIFDKEGIYNFKASVKDGEYFVEKEFSIMYYDTNLTDTQIEIPEDILDTLFLPNSGDIALLSSRPEYKLTIIDSDNILLSSTPLLVKPSKMALSEDGKQIVISADSKVYLVDINDTTNPSLLKTFTVPAELADIVMHKGYIYTLEGYTSWVDLYSINMDDSSYSKLEHASYGNATMQLNRSLEALYIIDSGVSPQDIEKVDISTGDAVELYDSPYHGDYEFCSKILITSTNQLLTGCGVQLTMSNIKTEDMLYDGTFISPNFLKNDYNRFETNIRTMDINEVLNNIAIAMGEITYTYDTSYLDGYPNTLEIRDLSDMSIKYNGILPPGCLKLVKS